MRDGRAELDVTHAFAANDRACDFNATLLADNALVADTPVLSAVTFVVLFGTEDLLVKETVLFRALGAVVDGFWLCDFAV